MSVHDDVQHWLSETALCSFEDLAELSGLAPTELALLVEAGVLQPVREGARLFASSCIVQVRRARRLRDDFELDAAGLAVAVNLLGRIQELERRLAELDAQRS